MTYTLAAAAAATGTNKTTILRAIKSGKITGTKNAHGQWYVEPAELHRVCPAVADAVGNAAATPQDAMGDAAALAVAQQRAAQAEDRLAELKAWSKTYAATATHGAGGCGSRCREAWGCGAGFFA
jgi:hypothetical protein